MSADREQFVVTRLDRDQAAVLGAFTGFLCGPFSDLHEYIEMILGRPVWTHELANEETTRQIKEAATPDFLNLVAEKP